MVTNKDTTMQETSDDPRGPVSATQAATATVLEYAPHLRTGPRLPLYRQPAISWQVAPTCDPAFAAYLKAIWSRLDLSDRTQFSEAEALCLRYLRMHGLVKLYRAGMTPRSRRAPFDWHEPHINRLGFDLTTILGDALLQLMTPADRAHWFPWHGYCFGQGHDRHAFTLHADSLQVVPSFLGQPLYVAPQRPPLVGHRVKRPVGFTAHAIERMQDRRTPHQVVHSASSLYDTFAMVAYSGHMQPAQLYGWQPAVALFDRATPGFFVHRYVEELLGDTPPDPPYLYRMGYGPLEREGDVWCVKTLLVSGYAGTPEYWALECASFAPGVKEQMQKACEQLTTTQLFATRDFSLLKWFHTHGIPQVIPEPAGAYRFPGLGERKERA